VNSRLSRCRGALALVLSASLAVTLNAQPAYAAKPKPYTPPKAAVQPNVKVGKVAAKPAAVSTRKQAASLPAPRWPGAASEDVALGQGGSVVTFRAVKGHAAPAKMHVDVLAQGASKTTGLLFRVRRNDGLATAATVGVSVDYDKFATAYGGDWATRLRLVRMPECALSTPQLAACQGVQLPTTNNAVTHQASADVAVAGSQLMALAAAPSGAAGSYGATSLSQSGTWSAGGSSGNFSWSFPTRTPPALGGPSPTVELGYSSQSIDGLMASSNNQPSVVGEGFNLSAGGFIERSYQTCSDDTTNGNNTGTAATADDECWATDNASLSLNGSGGDLIQDATDKNLWHLRNDDGSKVERRTGADNGAQGGEWWVVTTVNGTQYWFGKNKLPGWTSGDTTNSTLTVPVAGNQTGEPCHQDTFAASVCTQAYRWNLDYVVDPHGNTMSYWYSKDTNNYESVATKVYTYDRDSYLDHVSYGTRVEPDLATGKDTVFTGHASARVDFAYGDRCLSSCTTHDAAHWPDTPWDLACTSSTLCDARMPAFFSTHRLATITTSTYEVMTGKFRNVEQWSLTHEFPDPQDGTRAGLWLAKVGHTGLVGTAKTLPDVTFTGKAMPNRVDAVDNAPPMNWPRLTDINTETGAIVHVDYLNTDCTKGMTHPDPQANVSRCYPVKWAPPGFPKQTDYFNKYVVNEVTETDRTGGSTRVLNHYTYIGAPAWHYADDNGLIPDDAKTWSQWRGYQTVGVTTGDPGEQTYTETTYFRGMNGDHGSTGTVTVPDSLGGTATDEDAYAGMTRESRTLLGPGGAEVSGEIDDPWQSAPTASRTIDGTTVYARHTNTEGTHSRVTLDHAPGQRTTYQKSTFDSYGMVVKNDDYGDAAVAGDEQCTLTTYARNTTAWLVSLPSRVQTFATTCDKAVAGGLTDADVIGDSKTIYDSLAWGAAPTKGDVTETDQMTAYNSGSPTYAVLTKTSYDVLGRAVDSWDALTWHSATSYTPATAGPVTQTVDTNPKGWTTTTSIEPAWGLATATIDVNGLKTELGYDGLGRLTQVWQPGRTRENNDTPDVAYTYLIRTDGVNAVTTAHLNPRGGVTKSYTLYDGLLRTRQTQTASPSGGRILTDTFYDSAGRSYLEYGSYWDKTTTPGTDLAHPLVQEDVPNQTLTKYDGAGRPVSSIFQPNNVERWRTTTSYGGDHVDVSPPTGATATSTYTDARDRTIQLRQYPTRVATGTDYDHTDYAYNSKGLQASVTGPDGSKWTYGYDILGRQTSATDPDGASSTTKYDADGEVTQTTDGNGQVLTYTYDELGRKRATYKTAIISTANQLTQWDYDQATFADGVTPVKGQLSQASRLDPSGWRYVETTLQYDKHYQPLASQVEIPSFETGLYGTYVFTTGYNPDGSVSAATYPTSGDLAPETVSYGYTDYDQPLNMTDAYGSTSGVATSLVSDSQYDALAHATKYTLYTGLYSGLGSHAYLNFNTDSTTGRLDEISVHRDGANPNTVTDQHYTYDDAGNITKIADTPTGGGYTDIQCFTYDRYQRIQDAWTPTVNDCSATASNASLGGPAPYWQTYSYSTGGARTQLVDHATAKGDATTTYKYTDATATDPTTGQPHVLRSTTTTNTSGTTTASYTYDKAGHAKTRPGPNGTQTLVWDVEGHLQSVTDTAGSVSYLYDADGNRLVSRDTTGKTLYLPNEELRYTNSTSALTCTRYYSYGGGTVAQRTGAGLTWLASDHQGTQNVSIDATTQAATIRRQTPFGTPRGAAVAWGSDKGFVDGIADPTGLTHLGAREYDPVLGRFVSLDPVLDTSDPQSLEGYAYADNSPIVREDASGTISKGITEGGAAADVAAALSDPSPKETDNKPKSKHCNSWCKLKHGATAAANWVDDHKAVIAGAVVGIAVGIGCEAALGVTGPVGAVACGALAGAVGNMVQYAIETKVEHKGNFSLGGMLGQGAIGAVVGGLGGGLGSLAGTAIKAGVSSVASRFGAKAVADAVEPAVAKEASGVAGGLGKNAAEKGPAKAAAGAAKCHSFAAATAVLMANGTTKAISTIKVGDKVLAADPVTGEKTVRTVEVVHVNHDTKLTDVTVTANGHKTVIHTTQFHPFWDQSKQRWVNASDLTTGDRTQSTSADAPTVSSVVNFDGARTMYDLTINTNHTYYVLAGTTPILVHNTNAACDVPTLKGYAQQIREAGDHPAAVNQRVIAVGQDDAGNLVAGSSNGFDAGQAAAADTLGIRRVPSGRGRHAEENLIADNDGSMWPLKRVGTDARTPCGPTEHNCAQQLTDRGIEHG